MLVHDELFSSEKYNVRNCERQQGTMVKGEGREASQPGLNSGSMIFWMLHILSAPQFSHLCNDCNKTSCSKGTYEDLLLLHASI